MGCDEDVTGSSGAMLQAVPTTAHPINSPTTITVLIIPSEIHSQIMQWFPSCGIRRGFRHVAYAVWRGRTTKKMRHVAQFMRLKVGYSGNTVLLVILGLLELLWNTDR